MVERSKFVLLAVLVSTGLTLQGCGGSSEEKNPSISSEVSNVSKEMPSVETTKVEKSARTTAKANPSGGPFKAFPIYTDGKSPDNHFIPSGWMGDYGDIKFDDKNMDNPHSGTTAIKISYSNKATQGARWAGMYWQNPPNNWGSRPGGYDLTGAKKLTFWARGEKGGERIEEFKLGGITGEYADSDVAGIGPVVLTTEWQQYTIDLEGKDLSSISGGFCWSTNLDVNPEGATFFLDDIRYE